ncbi:MAG: F0F1 ATP synthase subunit epsilon [Crocinitomicaceae bacterium]|nr:F0F1 ATP synthase subunit epsilon [Crocinitomicaceae bacterium]|tara:strand:+ start:8643 stop:8933 length:291 start_codon:yes stop_codon:yes gene_type:complete
MQLEIITPEAEIFSGEAEAVQFPGLNGGFQVLSNHAPIISALSNGVVKVNLDKAFAESDNTSDMIKVDKSNKNVIRIDIKGGVMEMLNNKIIVLAE